MTRTGSEERCADRSIATADRVVPGSKVLVEELGTSNELDRGRVLVGEGTGGCGKIRGGHEECMFGALIVAGGAELLEVERREAKQLDVRLRRANFEHAKLERSFTDPFSTRALLHPWPPLPIERHRGARPSA